MVTRCYTPQRDCQTCSSSDFKSPALAYALTFSGNNCFSPTKTQLFYYLSHCRLYDLYLINSFCALHIDHAGILRSVIEDSMFSRIFSDKILNISGAGYSISLQDPTGRFVYFFDETTLVLPDTARGCKRLITRPKHFAFSHICVILFYKVIIEAVSRDRHSEDA